MTECRKFVERVWGRWEVSTFVRDSMTAAGQATLPRLFLQEGVAVPIR